MKLQHTYKHRHPIPLQSDGAPEKKVCKREREQKNKSHGGIWNGRKTFEINMQSESELAFVSLYFTGFYFLFLPSFQTRRIIHITKYQVERHPFTISMTCTTGIS